MNILAIFLLFSCATVFGAQPQIAADYMVEGNFHDVAIYMGFRSGREDGVITRQFAHALCQKEFPIIAGNGVFKKFISEHNNPKSDYNKVPFSDDDWLLYYYAPKDLLFSYFLLIPKEYFMRREKIFPHFNNTIDTIIKDKKISYSRNEIMTGFAIQHPEILKQVTINSFKTAGSYELTTLNRLPDIPQSMLPLIQILVKGKDLIFGMWNIYMIGHGTYPKLKLDEPLPKMRDLQESFNASIAGFPLSHFSNLIQFFTKRLSTNFLYYASCYGGDANLMLPYMTYVMNKGAVMSSVQKPDFVIAVGSISSRAGSVVAIPVECKVKEAEKIKVGLFFQQLEKLSIKTELKPTLFKDNELKSILEPLYPPIDLRPSNLPWRLLESYTNMVRISTLPTLIFPRAETPRAFALTSEIKVITNTLLRSHALEHKPIVLHDAHAILLYPETITVPLEVFCKPDQISPAIVSMLPGIGLHKIEHLETNIAWEHLWDCFNMVNPEFSKYFYIDRITFENGTIRHVLIFNTKNGAKILYVDPSNNIYLQDLMTINKLVNITEDTGKEEKNPAPENLHTNFTMHINNNPFANALYNYRLLPQADLDFDTLFDWKLLKTVIGKDDLALIEKGPVAVVNQPEPVEEPIPVVPSAIPLPPVQKTIASKKTKLTKAKGKKSVKQVFAKKIARPKKISAKKAPAKQKTKPKSTKGSNKKPAARKAKVVSKKAAAVKVKYVRRPAAKSVTKRKAKLK